MGVCALCAFMFASCLNPLDNFNKSEPDTNSSSATTGSIAISLRGIAASVRTVMPYSIADITSYMLTATCTGQTDIVQTVEQPVEFSLPSVNPGNWKITVAALDAANKVLYSGSDTVEVVIGPPAEAVIEMKPLLTAEGTGSFSITFEFPDLMIPAANVQFYLEDYSAETTTLLSAGEVKVIGTNTVTVSKSGLSSGQYRLDLKVVLGGKTLELPGGENIHIYDNILSTTPGGANVVCDSTSLTNTLTVYYVSATGGGTGERPNSPITFSEALSRINNNTLISTTNKGTIVLTDMLYVDAGFAPFTKPIAIRSIAPTTAQIRINASGVTQLFTVGTTTEAGSLDLSDITIQPTTSLSTTDTLIKVENGTLTLGENAILSSNSGSSGAAVHLTGASAAFNLAGGAIYMCNSPKGGAVLAEHGSVLLSSGYINNCTATQFGSAIYVAAGASIAAAEGAQTNMFGNTNIATIAGRIAVESVTSIPSITEDLDRLKATCEAPASADIKEAGVVVVYKPTTPTEAEIQSALAAADRVSVYIDISEISATILSPVTVNSQLYIKSSTVTLHGAGFDGNGAVTSGALMTGPLFTVNAGGVLIIDNTTITGSGTIKDVNAPLIRINGGTLALSGSTMLSENRSTANGGGIEMLSGSLTMKGSSSIDSCSAVLGGGIYMADGIALITETSFLNYCSAAAEGASLWVGAGTVTIDSVLSNGYSIGRSFLSDPVAGAKGGLIYQEGGAITCSSTISAYNNAATGLYLAGGTFTLAAPGKIYECNNSNAKGGGVYVTGIDENLYGTFNMTGGEISGNDAAYGAGIYVTEKGRANLSGGSIKSNYAEDMGGGVYLAEGTLELNGTQILNNTASVNGGGIWMNAGSTPAGRINFGPNAQAESIAGNTATSGSGGGVWNESPWINPFQLNGTESTAVDTYFSNNMANVSVNNYNTTTSGGFNETTIATSITVYKKQLTTFSGGIGGTTITSVTGIRKDPNLLEKAFTCSVEGTAPNQIWSYSDTEPLTINGEYIYTFTAVIDGQTYTISRTVYYDTTAPTLTASTPTASEGYVRKASINADDSNGSGIAQVEYSLDGTIWSTCVNNDSIWETPILGAHETTIPTLIFRATDMVGNLSGTITFTSCVVDLQAPTIEETGTITFNDTLTYSYESTVELTINGITGLRSGETYEINVSNTWGYLESAVSGNTDSVTINVVANQIGSFNNLTFTLTDSLGNVSTNTKALASTLTIQ